MDSSHVTALQQKHQGLDSRLRAEMARPAPDTAKIREIKKAKLRIKEEIASMPDYYRFSLDRLKDEVKDLWNMGLKSVLLFVKVEDHLKDNKDGSIYKSDHAQVVCEIELFEN